MANEIAAIESLRARILRVLGDRPDNDPYMDAVQLYDIPEIREVCADSNRMSIMLSDMGNPTRKNRILTRTPTSHPGTSIKFKYALRTKVKEGARYVPAPEQKQEPQTITVARKEVPEAPTPVQKAKPSITVTEKTVTIETESIRIVIEI